MGDRYADIAFTETVKSVQKDMGSRSSLRPHRQGSGGQCPTRAERDQVHRRARWFYVASISESGWPYVQFRGGPPGFLRVLDEKTLGFADFRGNRQYVTTGNVITNDRVSLFLMDYAHRRRLKIFGRMRTVATDEEAALLPRLAMANYPAVVERAFLIALEAFNWNCPQHITPRYTRAELADLFEKLPRAPRRQTCEAK